MPRITDFCSYIYIYVFGCKLRLVRLCDSDFGINPIDDITIGITCAYYYYYYYYYYKYQPLKAPIGHQGRYVQDSC